MIGLDAPFARSRQQESRRGILVVLRAVHHYAHGSRRAQEKGREQSRALAEHDRAHPDFVRLHFRSIAAFIFLVFILVPVWWVDFLLFSATAEYFAGRVFHSWSWLVPLVCFLSPGVLLFIEIGIGLQRDLARDEGGFGLRLRVWGWTTVGVALALVVPLAAVATTLAVQPSVSDPEAAASLRMQTAALAILAFAGHLLVLFGGRHAHDAKAFAAFKLRQLWLRAKADLYERRARMLAEAAVAAFKTYYHEHQSHNAVFPGARLEFGPFDALTRELINESFGYEFIILKSAPRREGNRNRRLNGHGQDSKERDNQRPPMPQDLEDASNGHSGRLRKAARKG